MAELSPRERRQLMRVLNALPPSIFDEVLFALNVPTGLVPGNAAPQGTRTSALVDWASGVVGCTLPELKAMVDEIVADYNWTSPPDDEGADSEVDEQPSPSSSKGATNTAARPSGAVRDQVFISYSHRDSEWLAKLQIHLKPLVRSGVVNLWDDTQIKPGAKWFSEIETALSRAKVAVLLVSANFLASDFIDREELPELLAAAEHDGLTVIWIPISFSMYEETAIAQYQAAHSPAQPLDSLSEPEQNQALVKICKSIRDAVQA